MDSPIEGPARVPTDTHDFAPYIRILGRGPGRSRSLTREEARTALGHVLRGEAMPEQIGALLMLLRYRGENTEEVVGLVEAARAHAGLPWHLAAPVDLDWPSYADGRTRGLPWYLLAALLVARSGRRVVMHGPVSGPGRQSLVQALDLLGLPHCGTPEAAEASLAAHRFAFLPLEAINPALAGLLALRGVLGLRSPLNTVGRLLDPCDARAAVDGVFHPLYIALHLSAATVLGRRITVLKGGGGEAEWAGAKALTLATDRGEQIWPAQSSGGKPDSVSAGDLAAVWRGARTDAVGEAIVIATAAVALFASGAAGDPEACGELARGLWDRREKAVLF